MDECENRGRFHLEIESSAPGYIKIMLSNRVREGMATERHPTIEQAIIATRIPGNIQRNQMNLTLEQQQAVTCPAAKILLCACPGSGKTTVLVQRIARMINEGTPPERIVVVTFTTAGATEMRNRLAALVGQDAVSRLASCSTLHAYCLKLLRTHGKLVGLPGAVSVLDAASAAELLAECVKTCRCKPKSQKELDVAVAERRAGKVPRFPSEVEKVAQEYFRVQQATGDLDFDNVLSLALMLLRKRPGIAGEGIHLLCDESQDNAAIDWAIYSDIKAETEFFCGDIDQSIFQFRGAAPAMFLQYSKVVGVEILRLSVNHRSTCAIVNTSQALITINAMRIPNPTTSGSRYSGDVPTVHEFPDSADELAYINTICQRARSAGKSTAVLWRTRDRAAECRASLRTLGFQVAEPRVADRETDARAKAGRAVLAFLSKPTSDRAASKVYACGTSALKASEVIADFSRKGRSLAATMNLELGDLSGTWDAAGFTEWLAKLPFRFPDACSWLAELAAELGDKRFSLADLVAAAQPVREEAQLDTGIHCGTLHSAKGREWDVVIMGGCDTDPEPLPDSELEEERRIFFVGITRARNELWLTWSKTRQIRFNERMPWQTLKRTRSRFVGEARL